VTEAATQPERPHASGSELPTGRLLAYALPALPLAAAVLPLIVFVPSHYTTVIGLPIAAVGWAMLAVRIIDAAADPLVGYLADRWHPAFGRRRLWVIVSAPLTAMASLALFAPPATAGILWLFLAGAVLSIAYSCMQVPYLAWGTELSRDYAGRTRIAAWREGFTAIGTLVALMVPPLVTAYALADSLPLPSPLASVGFFVAIGLPFLALIAIRVAPEPGERSRRRLPFREMIASMASNAPFRRLLAAFFVNGLANGFPAALFLLFVEYRLKEAGAAGPLLALYFVCGVAGVPLWFWLARTTSKHRAWAISMLVACAGFFPAAFAGPGDLPLFVAVCIVSGLAVGADIVLPTAMQGDVIDVETAESGEERPGLYLGLWAFSAKLALAAAVGIAFPILGALGFDPGRGVITGLGLMTLAIAYAVLPIPFKLLAIALVWRFPIDAERQRELRAKIERS
jgi:Na+/melibiose symporter-like transporter